MLWIEAKLLRETIPEWMQKIVEEVWGKEYLEKDVPEHTEKIPEGKWKLSKADRDNAFAQMFSINLSRLQSVLKSFHPDQHFVDSINKAYTKGSFDFNNLSLVDIAEFYKPVFRDIDGKKTKETGQLVLTNNLTKGTKWIDKYNKVFNKHASNIFKDPALTEVNSLLKQVNFDMDIMKDFDLYLYITDDPEAILSMSISPFYDSCQNLYSGSYREQLLSNVFDKNMKIAYLIFDTPFVDSHGNKHSFTSFARAIVRSTPEGFVVTNVYPRRLDLFFKEVLKKYAGIKHDSKVETYYYDFSAFGLPEPYVENVRFVLPEFPPNLSQDAVYKALLPLDCSRLEEVLEWTVEYSAERSLPPSFYKGLIDAIIENGCETALSGIFVLPPFGEFRKYTVEKLISYVKKTHNYPLLQYLMIEGYIFSYLTPSDFIERVCDNPEAIDVFLNNSEVVDYWLDEEELVTLVKKALSFGLENLPRDLIYTLLRSPRIRKFFSYSGLLRLATELSPADISFLLAAAVDPLKTEDTAFVKALINSLLASDSLDILTDYSFVYKLFHNKEWLEYLLRRLLSKGEDWILVLAENTTQHYQKSDYERRKLMLNALKRIASENLVKKVEKVFEGAKK